MAYFNATPDTIEELIEDLFRDAGSEASDVSNYLDGVIDAMRELQATVGLAEEVLEQADSWCVEGELDDDTLEAMQHTVSLIQDKLADAVQEILNAAR